MKIRHATLVVIATIASVTACASPTTTEEPTVAAPDAVNSPEPTLVPELDVNLTEVTTTFSSDNGYFFASPPQRWEIDAFSIDAGFVDQALWHIPGGQGLDYALVFAWSPVNKATVIGNSDLTPGWIAYLLGERAADEVVAAGTAQGHGDGVVGYLNDPYLLTTATGEVAHVVAFLASFEDGTQSYAPFVFVDVYGGGYSAAATCYDLEVNPTCPEEFDEFIESLAFWPAW